MDQKNRRKNKRARQKTILSGPETDFPPMNSTAFQFPIAMKKKKTNTQIINLVKEIKIIRTKFHKM